MASWPPKKNAAFVFYTALAQQADTRLLKSSPTLAAGDFKVSIDGGSLNNLGTLPTVTPASSVMVKISLSSSEMNGDDITVVCIDAAGAEWCDKVINIKTATRQVDDLAYPATSGRSMVVDANAVKLGPSGSGTAQTTRDIGASVLLSSGSGAGQLDFTSGVVKANLAQILGTALTETAGQIAAAFKQFFNIDSPTSTMNTVTTVTAVTNDVGITQGGADKAWSSATRTLTTTDGFKKNTAFSNFMFLMRDSTDHVSPKTALTVTAQRSIDGGTFANCTNSVTEVASGIYKLNLSAADLNGDEITFKFSGTGADTTYVAVKTNA
jgi:hypothetical protein